MVWETCYTSSLNSSLITPKKKIILLFFKFIKLSLNMCESFFQAIIIHSWKTPKRSDMTTCPLFFPQQRETDYKTEQLFENINERLYCLSRIFQLSWPPKRHKCHQFSLVYVIYIYIYLIQWLNNMHAVVDR